VTNAQIYMHFGGDCYFFYFNSPQRRMRRRGVGINKIRREAQHRMGRIVLSLFLYDRQGPGRICPVPSLRAKSPSTPCIEHTPQLVLSSHHESRTTSPEATHFCRRLTNLSIVLNTMISMMMLDIAGPTHRRCGGTGSWREAETSTVPHSSRTCALAVVSKTHSPCSIGAKGK
jgi:hypothetical protein